ncbi:M23 family metallopeptidase [Trichocoleus sp. FACHB-262]|uniref:M23 family metallopeptidase n=1 Tax=Trichocoleus sp. FACHB-262 TaxID=2692869 RepID=UPI0016843FD3|nr:M23 family metallopeptidase [Trichocoleus sp. FACHB-262]MBD2121297.1 M23 family metallopeptidase [Trichocoleus sp. FACHB-262]
MVTSPVQAQVASALPVTSDATGQYAPAWGQVSFASLPPFDSTGNLNVPEDADGQLDYNLSRSWQAGDSVLNVLKLGDVQDAFTLGSFTLGDAVRLGGVDPTILSLSNFSFLKEDTIAGLVNQIPAIARFKVSEVRPLYDLITQSSPNVAQTLSRMSNFRVWTEQPIAALAQLPEVGNLSLNHLDLSQYSFTQLPGLEQTTLSSIRDWKNLHLTQIPGLGNVPFSAFFNPGQFLGLIAIHDVTYGGDSAHQESRWTPTQHSITGSYEVGFHYECAQAQGCDYLELDSPFSLGSAGDPTQLHGARWIRGGNGVGTQMVPGGHGVLGTLNGGQEPTGRHPFGQAFKVVLTETDESTGTGKFGLYFRVCHRSAFVDLGCTPYFIGPVPWFSTHEKGKVLVGLTELPPPSGIQEPEILPEVQAMIHQYDPGTASDQNSQICQVDSTKLDALSRRVLTSLPSSKQAQALKMVPLIMQSCAKAGVSDPAQLAYILATAQHETDFWNTMDEYSRHHYDECGWGEGMIQVTWCDKKRFVLQRLGLSAYRGISDRRLTQPAIAADALCRGMKEGWYGHMRPLSQCIAGGKADYRCARQQVNGTDQWKLIGGYAQKFQKVLTFTGSKAATGTTALTCSSTSQGSGKGTGQLQNPIPGAPVTSEFGPRASPCAGCSSRHRGIDLGVASHTPVKAADGGTVVYSGWMSGYGETVIVEHGRGLMTLYAHNSKRLVKVGDAVSAGQIITRSGQSGAGTGPHLHITVIEGATPGNPYSGREVDPRKYIKF